MWREEEDKRSGIGLPMKSDFATIHAKVNFQCSDCSMIAVPFLLHAFASMPTQLKSTSSLQLVGSATLLHPILCQNACYARGEASSVHCSRRGTAMPQKQK